jgi:hypothetical protein
VQKFVADDIASEKLVELCNGSEGIETVSVRVAISASYTFLTGCRLKSHQGNPEPDNKSGHSKFFGSYHGHTPLCLLVAQTQDIFARRTQPDSGHA